MLGIVGQLAPPEYRTIILNVGTLLTGLGFAARVVLRRHQRAPALDVMGSAAWATPKAIADELGAAAVAADPGALLIGRGHGQPGPLLRYAGPAHLLTIAPTRSGKGVGTILPNLLIADRAVICVDPKGENARIAARARRRFGPVWVLDPFGVSGQPGASYDPTAALDPESPDLAEDATTLADALVYDPPGPPRPR